MKHIASGVAATPLAALSLLAVVVGVAGVGPQSLAYAGVSSSTSQDDQHGARLALDGNDAMSTDGIARHLSSGPAKNYPWLAADLGGRSKVTSVRVFGHSTNNNCIATSRMPRLNSEPIWTLPFSTCKCVHLPYTEFSRLCTEGILPRLA